MADDEEEGPEIHDMWATVVEIAAHGIFVQLDDDQEHGRTLIPNFWIKTLGFNPKTVAVGTRMRCGVQITWTPSYYVRKVRNIIHEGGKIGEE